MILVTGGAGFVGSNLVDLLLSQGARVRVLDNLSSGNIGNLDGAFKYSDRFEFLKGDICDDLTLAKAMVGVSAVIHLAAQVSVAVSIDKPIFSASSNVIGFLNVLEAARRSGINRIVYASSAAVFGHPAESPLNESSLTQPISPYGLEKKINEMYATLYQNMYGLNCLGLRFFNIYGPRQDPSSSYAGVISKFFSSVSNSVPLTVFGDGNKTRDFVHVSDVAKVCAKSVDVFLNGVLCVGTGSVVTINRLIELISDIVGKPVQIEYADRVVGDIRHSSMTPARLHQLLNVECNTDLGVGLTDLWSHISSN